MVKGRVSLAQRWNRLRKLIICAIVIGVAVQAVNGVAVFYRISDPTARTPSYNDRSPLRYICA
jgi:hypothetical protein